MRSESGTSDLEGKRRDTDRAFSKRQSWVLPKRGRLQAQVLQPYS